MMTTTDLAYAYPNVPPIQFPDLHLASREHLLILGPSGVGKTTLLYLLAGLLVPMKGSLNLNGIEYAKLSRKKMDRFRGETIGMIFQKYHFVTALSVDENLRLRQGLSSGNTGKSRRKELIERLGLSGLEGKKPHRLSQGQQQRLAIALGIIHQPKVILADEPTANLDDKNCEKVIALLKEEATICGSSLIIITHDSRVIKHFQNRIEL